MITKLLLRGARRLRSEISNLTVKTNKGTNNMDENNRALIFGMAAFFAGVMIGLGTGILLAPQSGERTRRQLQNRALDVQEDAETLMKDTKEIVSDWVGRGKKFMENS